MSNFNQRRDRQISDFRTIEDQRTLNDGYTDNRKDMYNAMLNLILKHKVELQKMNYKRYQQQVHWNRLLIGRENVVYVLVNKI